jgi:hypothetical protein
MVIVLWVIAVLLFLRLLTTDRGREMVNLLIGLAPSGVPAFLAGVNASSRCCQFSAVH